MRGTYRPRSSVPLAVAASGLLLVLVGAFRCGGDGGGASALDGGDVDQDGGATTRAFGEPCEVDDDCVTGLCLASDHAPSPWCARPCTEASEGGFCPQPDDEPPAFCVAYPDAVGDPLGEGFQSRGDIRRFCAPICSDAADCAPLAAGAVCDVPEWRGNPLYPDTTTRVCRGATIDGYDPDVDPADCAGWDADPGRFAEAALVCGGYCEYLGACQELPADQSRDCCGRDCFRRMTADDRLDVAWRNELTCFIDYFSAFRGTALVCSEPTDRCGAPPIP